MKEDVLPEGWELKKLENLADILDSQRKPINSKEREKRIQGKSDNKLFPYYGATGEVGKIDDYLFDEELVALGEDGVPFLDFNKDKAYMLYGKTWVNNHAHVLRAKKGITENKFLYYFLNQFDYRNYVNGGTRLKLTQANMRKIPVITPPLPEQQYLSQKLTALLDEVAQTKQRLEAIPARLKLFRQSVLADAVSGRLTEIAPQMTKMSDIAKFQNGFAFNSEDFSKSGEWQVFRLGNIRDGFLFYENKPVFISEKLAKTQEKFIPKVGDSLISMTGTRFKQDYGFACIVEKDEKILVNQRVGRIIPIKDKIIPKFLNLSLRSEHFRQQFFKGETGGVNQGNVGSKHIMSISINLPTLEQQTQIVQKVETYFALADEIEAQVNAALENVNLLTQSILAKAFCGELSAAWRNSQVTETQGNV